MSVTWLESQWQTSETCTGGPSLMIMFDMIDPSTPAYLEVNTNNWPIFYWVNAGYPYPYSSCGFLSTQLQSSQFCCTAALDLSTSNLDLHASHGWRSGSDKAHIKVTGNLGTDLQSFAPSGSAGNSYCLLSQDSDLVFTTYRSLAVLNDGNCATTNLMRSFRCSESGVLTLYSDDECGSVYESYSLTTTAGNITSPDMGKIYGQLFPIVSASSKLGWVAAMPVNALVPTFKNNAAEIFGLTGFVTSFLFFIVCIGFSSLQWYRRKTRIDALTVACFFLWIAAVSLQMVEDYITFPPCDTYKCYFAKDTLNLAQIRVYGMAQLLMTHLSTGTFHRVFNSTKMQEKFIEFFLMFAHFALNTGMYIRNIAISYSDMASTQEGRNSIYSYIDVNTLLYNWNKLAPYWIGCMFIWNIIPMNYALYTIANRRKQLSLTETLQALLKLDKNGQFLYINAMQIMVVFFYYLISSLMSYTTYLATDRNYLAMDGILAFLISVHCVLNYAMSELVKEMLRNLSGKKGKEEGKKQSTKQNKTRGGHSANSSGVGKGLFAVATSVSLFKKHLRQSSASPSTRFEMQSSPKNETMASSADQSAPPKPKPGASKDVKGKGPASKDVGDD